MIEKIKKHARQGTLAKTIAKAMALKTDKLLLANNLSFDNYYFLQRTLGFPVQRIIFHSVNGYWPNLKDPRSFNEKCLYLKLLSRNPILPIISDKYRVREYVANKIGKEVLIPLLQITNNPNNIKFSKLPDQFVIKTNFASGQTIIISDKNIINENEIVNRVKNWMTMKYRIRELIWFPQHIERKIIIEKYLNEYNQKVPVDYKFYVFNGKIKFIRAMSGRFESLSAIHYDIEWNKLSHKTKKGSSNKHIEKPDNLKDMITIAECLGSDFDFMRVDLYDTDHKVYFGELSAYPGNALLQYDPVNFDYELGDCWKMDISYMKS